MQIVRRTLISLLFAASAPTALAGTPSFSSTGIASYKVKAFLFELQQAVATHDVVKLADMINYPLIINGKTYVATPKYFETRYNRIFTKNVTIAVARQKFKTLFGNYDGVMIGNGQIWFSGICLNVSCNRYTVKIVAINN